MRRWIALHISITTDVASAVVWDDAAVQRAVVSMALGLTPRVALVDEFVLLDVTGSLRLFGGLTRLLALLSQRITAVFEATQSVATVRHALGATSLIAIGHLRQALLPVRQADAQSDVALKKRVADLPMHTLTAARAHLDVLERIGCRTWDDLLRLPRDGVARRFGAGLLAALDRARGQAADDYVWQVLPEQFNETLELEALVIHATALMAGVERLLVPLHAWLLGRQSGISALKITWHLDKRRDVAPTGELEIRTAQPAQDLRHVARLISEQLAQQQLAAPVHSLSLHSLTTELLSDSAAATGSLLMAAQQAGDSLTELVERLSARLGDAQVQAWQAAADHRPEQMQRWVDAKSVLSTLGAGQKTEPHHVDQTVLDGELPVSELAPALLKKLKAQVKSQARARAVLSQTRTEALYPSWLLSEPCQLAMVGNSPVYQGKLTRLAGPQRVESTGWTMAGESKDELEAQRARPPVMRDYFIYRSEQGALLWIFSERLSTAVFEAQRRIWFLHGVFA